MYQGNPDLGASEFADVLALVTEFVQAEVLPREQEIMADDRVPDTLLVQAARLGLFGYAIPQRWGGLGLDLVQDVELAMVLGYTSLAFRSAFGTNNGIAGQVLVGFRTSQQRDDWLPRLASGEVVASFALTEPGAGSSPDAIRTTATASGDGWVLEGTKRFITNAPQAGLFVVFARARREGSSEAPIGVFLVPRSAPGVRVGPPDATMGQEGSHTAEVSFTSVELGPESLVGADVSVGYRAAMTSLARGRIHVAALAVGAARRALAESVAHASVATQADVLIGQHQLVQAMLADLFVGVMAGEAMVRAAAISYATGADRRIAPSAAKLFCTEMAGRAADLAVQVHGGTGYMRGTVVERLYRDVRLMRLYEGTSEIQRLIVGGGLVQAATRAAR